MADEVKNQEENSPRKKYLQTAMDYNKLWKYVNAVDQIMRASGEGYQRLVSQNPRIEEEMKNERGEVTLRSLNRVLKAYPDLFNLGDVVSNDAEIERLANHAVELGARKGSYANRGHFPVPKDVDEERAEYLAIANKKYQESEENFNAKKKEWLGSKKDGEVPVKGARAEKRAAGRKVARRMLIYPLITLLPLSLIGLAGLSVWGVVASAVTSTFGLTSGAGIAGILTMLVGGKYAIKGIGAIFSKANKWVKKAFDERKAAKEKAKGIKAEYKAAKERLSVNQNAMSLDGAQMTKYPYPGNDLSALKTIENEDMVSLSNALDASIDLSNMQEQADAREQVDAREQTKDLEVSVPANANEQAKEPIVQVRANDNPAPIAVESVENDIEEEPILDKGDSLVDPAPAKNSDSAKTTELASSYVDYGFDTTVNTWFNDLLSDEELKKMYKTISEKPRNKVGMQKRREALLEFVNKTTLTILKSSNTANKGLTEEQIKRVVAKKALLFVQEKSPATFKDVTVDSIVGSNKEAEDKKGSEPDFVTIVVKDGNKTRELKMPTVVYNQMQAKIEEALTKNPNIENAMQVVSENEYFKQNILDLQGEKGDVSPEMAVASVVTGVAKQINPSPEIKNIPANTVPADIIVKNPEIKIDNVDTISTPEKPKTAADTIQNLLTGEQPKKDEEKPASKFVGAEFVGRKHVPVVVSTIPTANAGLQQFKAKKVVTIVGLDGKTGIRKVDAEEYAKLLASGVKIQESGSRFIVENGAKKQVTCIDSKRIEEIYKEKLRGKGKTGVKKQDKINSLKEAVDILAQENPNVNKAVIAEQVLTHAMEMAGSVYSYKVPITIQDLVPGLEVEKVAAANIGASKAPQFPKMPDFSIDAVTGAASRSFRGMAPQENKPKYTISKDSVAKVHRAPENAALVPNEFESIPDSEQVEEIMKDAENSGYEMEFGVGGSHEPLTPEQERAIEDAASKPTRKETTADGKTVFYFDGDIDREELKQKAKEIIKEKDTAEAFQAMADLGITAKEAEEIWGELGRAEDVEEASKQDNVGEINKPEEKEAKEPVEEALAHEESKDTEADKAAPAPSKVDLDKEVNSIVSQILQGKAVDLDDESLTARGLSLNDANAIRLTLSKITKDGKSYFDLNNELLAKKQERVDPNIDGKTEDTKVATPKTKVKVGKNLIALKDAMKLYNSASISDEEFDKINQVQINAIRAALKKANPTLSDDVIDTLVSDKLHEVNAMLDAELERDRDKAKAKEIEERKKHIAEVWAQGQKDRKKSAAENTATKEDAENKQPTEEPHKEVSKTATDSEIEQEIPDLPGFDISGLSRTAERGLNGGVSQEKPAYTISKDSVDKIAEANAPEVDPNKLSEQELKDYAKEIKAEEAAKNPAWYQFGLKRALKKEAKAQEEARIKEEQEDAARKAIEENNRIRIENASKILNTYLENHKDDVELVQKIREDEEYYISAIAENDFGIGLTLFDHSNSEVGKEILDNTMSLWASKVRNEKRIEEARTMAEVRAQQKDQEEIERRRKAQEESDNAILNASREFDDKFSKTKQSQNNAAQINKAYEDYKQQMGMSKDERSNGIRARIDRSKEVEFSAEEKDLIDFAIKNYSGMSSLQAHAQMKKLGLSDAAIQHVQNEFRNQRNAVKKQEENFEEQDGPDLD